MLNTNENIRTGAVRKALLTLSLEEAILDRHWDKMPPTCDKGLSPIDGIFTSPSLQITRGGYLPFNQHITSDHHTLWVGIRYRMMLGSNIPQLIMA